MLRPRYCFTFVYEYICGDWSFYCIYADSLSEAMKQFAIIPSELYIIKFIDRKDNHFRPWEKGYEPEIRIFAA